jgi:hypothetical protein
VLFFGWSVFPLVLLYWLENVIVGAFNVAKMLIAHPREVAYWAGKLFIIPFFVVHFGMFTYVHGALLVALLGPKDAPPFSLLRRSRRRSAPITSAGRSSASWRATDSRSTGTTSRTANTSAGR